MIRDWLVGLRKQLALAGVVLLAGTGVARAGDNENELRALIEQQGKQIEELKKQIQGGGIKPAADGADKPTVQLDDQTVRKIIADYLKENPGAGMPPSVQTGYSSSTGFAIRSTNNPGYVKWEDESKIPFELRIRGRMQLDYYGYFPTDSRNHLLGVDTGNNTSPNFSQLLAKRARLIFEGTAFDPDFRYHFTFDGNTRGLAALAGGGVPAGNGTNGTGGVPGVPDGNGVATVDHAVRLFSAWVAYDFHPCAASKGCGGDCPEGTYKYAPTFTILFGKMKPLFSFEEYLGSFNQQFVEYGMSEWFFDAEDDNLMMQAGFEIKALDDRFFMHAVITNGNETQIANLQMDDYPGFNVGMWYDFGGDWDKERGRWRLYGDGPSDLEWHVKPVLRVGAATNVVPMDRHSEFTNAELNRVRVVPGAPGGTGLVGLLNGAGFNPNASGVGQFAVDKFDSYTYEAWAAAKWKGFSILNDWWVRDVNDITGRKAPTGAYPGNGINQPILYTANNPNGSTFTALFPNKALIDWGMMLQGGYFIIPKKLEIAARWSWIRGESGNINGDGTGSRPLTAAERARFPGVPAATLNAWRVVNGAFSHPAEANEYAIGFNYFFKGQQLKWSSDFSVYNGGNPAAGGQSPAGFIPGVDGWMIRSQIQFAF